MTIALPAAGPASGLLGTAGSPEPVLEPRADPGKTEEQQHG